MRITSLRPFWSLQLYRCHRKMLRTVELLQHESLDVYSQSLEGWSLEQSRDRHKTPPFVHWPKIPAEPHSVHHTSPFSFTPHPSPPSPCPTLSRLRPHQKLSVTSLPRVFCSGTPVLNQRSVVRLSFPSYRIPLPSAEKSSACTLRFMSFRAVVLFSEALLSSLFRSLRIQTCFSALDIGPVNVSRECYFGGHRAPGMP